uniref:Ig-like domain-containing protein n=1 Tax=Denticeps clupeoides TaxID=299321 RepID=A0AAY4CMP5_9TELE
VCSVLFALFIVIHSWLAFYTVSTGTSGFPEFISVSVVDNEVMGYFDSNTHQFESRQTWMKQLGAKYVERQTDALNSLTAAFKDNIKTAMNRFNQTQGVHFFQRMYGCEWDDETGVTDGYSQFAYDGEDFLTLDLKSTAWVAVKPQASITKQKNDGRAAEYQKNYLTQECVHWLKKYVDYGKISLERKVPPQVSLLQTDSSSPVVCHATGFYPDKVMISWQKDGQDLHEDVNVGETLPNHDGTFQKRAKLKVTPDERKKNQFTCVVEHKSGDPIHMILTEEKIRTNSPGTGASRQNRQFSCFNVLWIEMCRTSLQQSVVENISLKIKSEYKCPPNSPPSIPPLLTIDLV